MRMFSRLALDLPPACHDTAEVGVRQAAPDLKACFLDWGSRGPAGLGSAYLSDHSTQVGLGAV